MASVKVFVGSLPPNTKSEELRHLFENYGIVVECDIMNRCGFVHMKNIVMAENAIIALNATEFKGQTIVVERGRPKDIKNNQINHNYIRRDDHINCARNRERKLFMKDTPHLYEQDRNSQKELDRTSCYESLLNTKSHSVNNNMGPIRNNYRSKRQWLFKNYNNDSHEGRNNNNMNPIWRKDCNDRSNVANKFKTNHYLNKTPSYNIIYDVQHSKNNDSHKYYRRHNFYESVSDGFNGNAKLCTKNKNFGSFGKSQSNINNNIGSAIKQNDTQGFALPSNEIYDHYQGQGQGQHQNVCAGINYNSKQLSTNNTYVLAQYANTKYISNL